MRFKLDRKIENRTWLKTLWSNFHLIGDSLFVKFSIEEGFQWKQDFSQTLQCRKENWIWFWKESNNRKNIWASRWVSTLLVSPIACARKLITTAMRARQTLICNMYMNGLPNYIKIVMRKLDIWLFKGKMCWLISKEANTNHKRAVKKLGLGVTLYSSLGPLIITATISHV